MNYTSLEGVVYALSSLKSELNSLKTACTSEILMLDTDKWTSVQSFIQGLIDEVEAAKSAWPSEIGAEMQSIETTCKNV